MKKLIDNKYILFFIAFILGGGLVWIVIPSPDKGEETKHIHSNSEQVWTCSMHPQIRQNEPGDCPICGMDLIPLEGNRDSGVDPRAVSMSPTAMQLANVSTMIVGREKAIKTIRLSGKIQEDERLITSQTTHFPGRIEKLKVNFTGEYVKSGTVIATLYSPELVTAQEELFEAQKLKEKQPAFFEAAKEKLKNWKLSDQQIDQILKYSKIRENFPVRAEHSGYVIEKKVNQGDYVQRGQTLYEIANLSSIWVLFDVYEKDLSWVNKGDSVRFSINSIPGETFSAKIDFIDPVINASTRVAQARAVLQNKSQKLKPEMFVSGVVETKTTNNGEQIIVPKSAVMWTGTRSIVYVKLKTEQGLYFKMREVTLGPALGEDYIINEGLEPGEEIAINGTFSIDAAAQLADKPSMMNEPIQTKESSHSVASIDQINTSTATIEVNDSFKKQLKDIFQSYIPLKEALVESNLSKVKSAAKVLNSTINQVDMKVLGEEAHDNWMKDLGVLRNSVKSIIETGKLAHAREAFYPLSDQLFHSLKRFKADVNAYRQYCPMAFDNSGGFWLSDQEEIRNPYFGDQMLTCGNVEEEL